MRLDADGAFEEYERVESEGTGPSRCTVCHAPFEGRRGRCPIDGGELVPLPDPRIGQTVGGRYVIRERIGAGGMGVVYRAHHEVIERDVAIKFLAPSLARNEKHRKRFLREARAANRVNHEHIINVTDFGETQDRNVFLVMDYLEGTPLSTAIDRGSPLELDRCLRIALQTAQALGRAHELDVVHRDIKPDNVYLVPSEDGELVKILDFGLAHMKEELGLTSKGVIYGTPEYMPPEQADGALASPAADLYALGCLIFEMITGRPPFEGSNTELVIKHASAPVPALSQLRAAVPEALDGVVQQLLSKEPEHRPPSAHHVVEMLWQAYDALPYAGPGSAAPRQSELAETGLRSEGSQTLAIPLTRAAQRLPAASERGAITVESPRGPGSLPDEPAFPPPSFEDWWLERIAMLSTCAARAYPGGAAPGWLDGAIAELERKLAHVEQMRRERDERASQVAGQEQRTRELRMRIGRALDELGRDDAALADPLARAQDELRQAEGTRRPLAASLAALYRALPAQLGDADALDRAAVEQLAGASELAARWLEADRRAEAARARQDDLQRQRDDLRFQVAQLKGRLASLSAETDCEVDQVKRQAAELDRQARTELGHLVQRAEPVIRHLQQFPELGDLLRAASRPARGGDR